MSQCLAKIYENIHGFIEWYLGLAMQFDAMILVIPYSKLLINDFVCLLLFSFTRNFIYLVHLGHTLAFPSALTLTFSRSRVTLANIVGHDWLRVGKKKKKTQTNKKTAQTNFE